MAVNKHDAHRRASSVTKPVVLLGIVALLAVSLGVFTALARSSSSDAWAVAHCTRYATYAAPDTGCTFYQTLSAQQWRTPSSAYRDTNEISMTTSHYWTLYYDDNTGPFMDGTSGGGTETRPSPFSLPANCYSSHSSSIVGYCYTWWH